MKLEMALPEFSSLATSIANIAVVVYDITSVPMWVLWHESKYVAALPMRFRMDFGWELPTTVLIYKW